MTNLDDLKWNPVKIIGPPFMIFLEGDKIVGVLFDKESNKSVKEPIKHKRRIGKLKNSVKFTKGKMKIK